MVQLVMAMRLLALGEVATGSPPPPQNGKKGSFRRVSYHPLLQVCSDHCCNATNCQLREGAECGRGECCQDCKVPPPKRSCALGTEAFSLDHLNVSC